MEIKMKYGCKNCSSKDFELITNGLKYVRVKCSECGIEREHKQPFEFINEKGNKTTFAGCVILEENISWPDLSKRGGFLEKGAEKKIEKIVVRNVNDLIKYRVGNIMGYEGFTFTVDNDLSKIVKVLNALGGNFEYKPKIIIDTDSLFNSMLINISKGEIYYDYDNEVFFTHDRNEKRKHIDIETVEERYDVDFKILK